MSRDGIKNRRPVAVGAYSITSKGIKERINTSAPTLGSAISKALTIASRLQREIKLQDEFITFYIRRIGDMEPLVRVEVDHKEIRTWA